MKIRLTDREAQLMHVLWRRGPSTVAEVRDGLADELAYTTVQTVLRTLEGKGFVTHSAEGRIHRYAATVSQHEARRNAARDLARKLFDGSTELLLTHLVTDRKLTDRQISRIRKLLNESGGEESS